MKPNTTRPRMFAMCIDRFATLPPHQLYGVVNRLIWPITSSCSKATLLAAWQIMDFIEGKTS